ncbi:TolC family outer membrane protein [Magnetococcales bacterium HHB-1]
MPLSVYAQSLTELLPPLLVNHATVKAATLSRDAAHHDIKDAQSDWFPSLDISATAGREKQNKPSADDSDLWPQNYSLTLTQLLWDFGAINASIDTAKAQAAQTEAGLNLAQQSLALEAITAYLNVKRAATVLDFARQSEKNIKQQTKLEDIRIRKGLGISTDLLQAKTQLAGANARRVRAEGDLKLAINRFRAVFSHNPKVTASLELPKLPATLLPDNLATVVKIAKKNNPRLLSAKLDVTIAEASYRNTRASNLFPQLEVSGSWKDKDDDSGTAGKKSELLMKLELSQTLNIGPQAWNQIASAKKQRLASDERLRNTLDLVEEEARNAWDQLETARKNADYLNSQAKIAEAFLKLARKERELGRRTLLDVLSGETALINSRSDAAAAEMDIYTATFSVLSAMGQLDPDTLHKILK